jgi:cobalt-zinc-cadmium efflux system protein
MRAPSGHAHDHLPDGALDRRLWATAALNLVITAAELAGGLVAGSLALLSDAAHNLGDVGAVVVALGARRLSRRSPTTRHTYGFKRAEVLAALANAVTLIAVTALIAREAVQRLLHPTAVDRGTMLLVALVALGANAVSVVLLRRHEHDDVNVRSAFLHLAQDALASVAVVAAALLARTAAGAYVDAAAALLVGLVVLRSALSLAWETVSTLLEGAPRDVDVATLAERVARLFSPARLHHVHVWELGPGQRLLTAHVVLARDLDGGAITALLKRLKVFLNDEWAISHATLEPEVVECARPELLGRWDRPAPAASSIVPADDHRETAP